MNTILVAGVTNFVGRYQTDANGIQMHSHSIGQHP